MSNWLFGLPVLAMAVLILAAIYLATAALYFLVTALAVGERVRAFKAVSPGVLSCRLVSPKRGRAQSSAVLPSGRDRVGWRVARRPRLSLTRG